MHKCSDLCFLDEFGDDYWVFPAHVHRATKVCRQICIIVGNVHGGTAENIGRSNNTRIAYFFTKLLSTLIQKLENCIAYKTFVYTSNSTSSRHFGCLTLIVSSNRENLKRFSALSIMSGEVPKIRTCKGLP